MKKIVFFVIVLLLNLSLDGCIDDSGYAKLINKEYTEYEEVKSLVKSFGNNLKNVSLMASKDIVINDIKKNYSDFVSEKLLKEWINDPINAPGRVSSSPWPDHIDIISIKELSNDRYEVKGNIIYLTSVEVVRGGYSLLRPVDLLVKNIDGNLLIDSISYGEFTR